MSYVEQREGVYRILGTRVSLDSIVYAFLDGQSAEAIAQAEDFEAKRAAARAADAAFYRKLAEARK